jgi:hypothetical protein
VVATGEDLNSAILLGEFADGQHRDHEPPVGHAHLLLVAFSSIGRHARITWAIRTHPRVERRQHSGRGLHRLGVKFAEHPLSPETILAVIRKRSVLP